MYWPQWHQKTQTYFLRNRIIVIILLLRIVPLYQPHIVVSASAEKQKLCAFSLFLESLLLLLLCVREPALYECVFVVIVFVAHTSCQ